MLEFIGVIVVTLALLLPTVWFFGLFFASYAFAGIDCFDKIDWLILLAGTVGIVVGWYFWWEHIGSKVNVSFG